MNQLSGQMHRNWVYLTDLGSWAVNVQRKSTKTKVDQLTMQTFLSRFLSFDILLNLCPTTPCVCVPNTRPADSHITLI